MLSQIYEVFEDIVIPWQRDIKEKRDLLREDPFLGFIALSVLGAAFYFFTRQSPSWLGFILHYSGIAMFILGGIAALASGWFGWGLYRLAAWPTVLLVLLVYGCFDTYQVSTTSEPKRLSGYRIEEGVMRTITQTDDIKRFTGRPLHRCVVTLDEIAGRPVHRTIEEGPLNSAEQRHGRWEVAFRGTVTFKWYWQGKEVTASQWQQANNPLKEPGK